ncbi:beta strand repeat-containing protein, partial [Haemophilus influenzae]|uniref:beta strand repeat-containing protein n=1 Tax=Haemophilus influenzae TaxID=727 RepID=UPI0018653DF5
TYLGGDERGEGKNGIQLAKKTSLEKGSTINVSGKEKGGRAIVWGDIALINGNINAQGSDIAETGGFVETSGRYLSIDDNVIVKTKEWLLDPENVSIEAPNSRNDSDTDSKFLGQGTRENPIKNNPDETTLTNTTISGFLKNAKVVNITASNNIYVNSSINIGSNGHLILSSEGKKSGGVEINENITSEGGSLTIDSKGWVDIHKNITLGKGFLNITSGDSVAFEGKDTINKNRRAADAQITAQGTIRLTGENKTFRLNNVSLNGTGDGLNIISIAGNLSHRLDGEINISGNVTINQTTHSQTSSWKSAHDSYWNVSTLTLNGGARFTFVKYVVSNNSADFSNRRETNFAGVKFRGSNGEMNFVIGDNARAEFKLKSNENTGRNKPLPIQFLSNISAVGKGTVFFDIYANHRARSTELKMSLINISKGLDFSINSHVRGGNAFEINKDLTINATGSNFSLKQTNDSFVDKYTKNAINSNHNLTILGGNVTLGGQNSSSAITGSINIGAGANVTLQAYNGNDKDKKLTLGNVSVEGELRLVGASANINNNLSIKNNAKFKAETNDNLNITGTFTNNGISIIDIKQGVVNIQGNITNDGSLNITTNAQNNQKTIINGNITNNSGDLSITDNKTNAEIQIGGNISQKEGNLTISSDKVNITNQITIKAGVNGEGSSSSATNNANLTIKTKELKLAQDLNISGFNKAEITAKEGADLIIGNSDNNNNANAKKVTFDKVKDSKISANGHKVTLNSKVETSNGNSDAASDSNGNNAGLTISAKDVTVNNNITSHKTVNISAEAGSVTTKEDTTINATTGDVEVTAKTGDIKGEVKSSSGSVTLTATGDALTVSNVTAKNDVTVKAETGKLTTTSGGTIKSEESKVELTAQSGLIDGNVEGKNQVNVTASTGSLTIKNSAKVEATDGAATLTANNSDIAGNINAVNVTLNTTGTLTTVAGSKIEAASGTLVINAKDAQLNGAASGDHTVVNATNASGSGSVTAKTSSNVNITGDLSTINGLNIISKNGRNTVVLKGTEIDVKYIQPGVASANEVIEAKRVLEKVKDLSDEERETLAKLGVSAVRFVEPNNAITVNTQNEFTTRPSSQVTISEGKACFSSGNGAAVCTNITDGGQQ